MTGPLPSDMLLAVDVHLHDGLRHANHLARWTRATLDADAEPLDVEIFGHLAQHRARQQFKRRVGALVGVAKRFLFLDLVEQAANARIVA